VANTVDPLGGSWFVESLTNEVERQGWRYLDEIDGYGGMVAAIQAGYPQKEIAESAYQYQRAVEAKEKVIVGVNELAIAEDAPSILYIDESIAQQQSAKLKALRQRRSNEEIQRRLESLKKAAAQEPTGESRGDVSSANTMPYLIDAVRAYATVGEICQALREVYGTYTESSIT